MTAWFRRAGLTAMIVLTACGGGRDTDDDAAPDATPDATAVPFTLVEVGHVALEGIEDVQVAGDLVYANVGDERVLASIDVHDPAAPTVLDTLDPSGVSGANTHFTVANGFAYVPRESDGLLVVNLGAAAALVESGRDATDIYAKDVAVANGTAYVADQDHGLVIVDVSSSAPARLGSLATDGQSYLNEHDGNIDLFPVSAASLASLIELSESGVVSHSVASQKIFPVLLNEPDRAPLDIANANNWLQNSNTNELESLVDEVINAMQDKVLAYKKGKKGLIGLFVGEVMKKSNNTADPKLVNQLLAQKLN